MPTRVHTLRSASLEYGLHPKRLRKLLHAQGVIHDADLRLKDHEVQFSGREVTQLLETLSRCMSLIKAGEYLNAPRPHERLLFEAGFIEPFITGGTETIKDHGFARQDLDRFLAKLLRDARERTAGLVNIPSAAKQANCSAMEIVQLLLDRKLKTVGRAPDTHGYISVLVDVDEVRPLVAQEHHGGLSLRQVEQEGGWSTGVVKALVDGGLLPTRTVINPVKRNPQRVVMPDELEAFQAEFVTLQGLAKERGIHFMRLKTALDGLGVKPVPEFADVPATFYRRKELRGLPEFLKDRPSKKA